MAGKSPTELLELIRDLEVEVARQAERQNVTRVALEEVNLVGIRERLAVLESQIAEIKKREEENDRRRWQFWLGVGVVVLTFVANLTINLLMFFAKKSG